MTVRIRQLIRVAGKGPTPPPAVTMAFVQQPTDTQVGQPFNPPVSVQISDGQSDVLIITPESGDCHVQFAYATADSTGLATFVGLNAGDWVPVTGGCTLRVHNVMRPQIADIISQPFRVLPGPPPVVWELIAKGSANGPMGLGLTLDTTGANLIVMTLSGLSLFPNLTWTDNFGQLLTPLTRFSTGGIFQLQSAILLPPFQTASNHTLWLNQPVAAGGGFPAVNILAFHAPNPVLRIEGPLFGNGVYGTSVQSLNAAVIDFPNALVLSGYTTVPVITAPAGYQIEKFEGIPGVNFDTYTGYRILTEPGTEQPLWQAQEDGNLITNLIVFQGAP